MFCKNCGAEIADNAAFCPKCGSKVSPQAGTANFAGQNTQPYGQAPQGGYQNPMGGYPYQPARSAAPGKVILIIAGILVLIGGIITVVYDMQLMPYLRYMGGIGGALVFEILFGIFTAVAGVCALVFCGRKDKGGLVFMMGIVVVILRIIDWIMASALFGGLVDVVTASSVILGFICPILIIVGGYLNKKN